jgi:hypothetical protein
MAETPPVIRGWEDPPDTIRLWHLDDGASLAVQMWFGSWVPDGTALDGARSVILPTGDGRLLKIKGAGLFGGPVDFSRFRASGPKALWFDFEGRVAEDVAMGHDAAHPGGASFQQAVIEWDLSRRLATAGKRLPACLGYGRITRDGRASWFSVFDWPRDVPPEKTWPEVTPEAFIARLHQIGGLIPHLAIDHGVLGFPSAILDAGGTFLIKDLHPFRQASPLNMSQITFAMHLFHALHIKASDARHMSGKAPGLPAGVQSEAFRPVLPEVTLADHLDAINRVLLPYMLKPAPEFRVETLLATLRSNRITARLLDLVPAEYARFD